VREKWARETAWTTEERRRAGQPFGRGRFRTNRASRMVVLPGGIEAFWGE